MTGFPATRLGVIEAEEAFSFQVVHSPAGESMIGALAKETGGFEDRLRYPGESGEYEKRLLDRLGL